MVFTSPLGAWGVFLAKCGRHFEWHSHYSLPLIYHYSLRVFVISDGFTFRFTTGLPLRFSDSGVFRRLNCVYTSRINHPRICFKKKTQNIASLHIPHCSGLFSVFYSCSPGIYPDSSGGGWGACSLIPPSISASSVPRR